MPASTRRLPSASVKRWESYPMPILIGVCCSAVEGENAQGEMRRVLRVIDADARDRYAGRHLNDTQQRIETTERGRQWDTDHRQLRVCSHDAWQCCRKARAANDDA